MKRKRIGEQVREARLERGLSQERVADRITSLRMRDDAGKPIVLSGAALSRIEAGKWMPSFNSLRALARALDVTFEIGPKATRTLVYKEEEDEERNAA